MILQALTEYYERKREADPDAFPEPGFERKEIPFLIVLSEDGRFLNLEDTREGEGKKKRGRRFTVPQGARTSGIAPRILWDDFRYVLGISREGTSDREKRRDAECHASFVARQREVLSASNDVGTSAVIRFLEGGDFASVVAHPLFREVEADPRQLVSFRLSDATMLVVEDGAVVRLIRSTLGGSQSAQCLVTGTVGPISISHPPIKGIRDRPGAPAEKRLVAFNTGVSPAFSTHGRSQGANAPISERAAFAYTTALNRLLDRNSRLKAHLADTTVVFWAAKGNPVEDFAAALFQDDTKLLDDPEQGVEHLRHVFNAPWQGHPPVKDDRSHFYVLGLAPNSSRVAIRFWHRTTVAAFAEAVLRHFEDIEVARPPWLPRHPSIRALLKSTAVLGKEDNIPPNLAGAVLASVVSGGPYPRTMLSATVQRIRAEPRADPDGKPDPDRRTRPEAWADRVSIIKGCLLRDGCLHRSSEREVDVSLDPANSNVGYLLGRLFAALERTQEESRRTPENPNPGTQGGIRERYYASASATPVAAFPTLMKLKNHHLAKIESRGTVVNLERLIGSISDSVDDFPAVLSLADQGRFALGYYHQRQDFFTAKKAEAPEEASHV